MAQLPIVRTFDCPYDECVWPRCKTDMTECMNHPLCGHEIEATKMKILQGFNIKPRPKMRRRKS
jgi:hypothetical protein